MRCVAELTVPSPSGSATMTAPADGFTSPPFAQLFGQYNSTKHSAPSTASTPPSHPIRKGAIAGAVVGGIAGLALIAGALTYFLRRNRRRGSHISTHQISAPINTGPTYEVAGPDVKPPAELEHRTYVELPADRGVEIRGAVSGKSEGKEKDVPDI